MESLILGVLLITQWLETLVLFVLILIWDHSVGLVCPWIHVRVSDSITLVHDTQLSSTRLWMCCERYLLVRLTEKESPYSLPRGNIMKCCCCQLLVDRLLLHPRLKPLARPVVHRY
ncbi:hypothetical protein BC628DRAFT_817413 [Trametes gibbosa]|nr:hypothetical protein BC628DRAFT_817413 [Trametes gibbosa]